MKELLYIGNKLAEHGFNQTSIETLGPLLEREGFKVEYASSQRSKVLRLLEMIYKTWSVRKSADYVLIDTYSTYNFWYAYIISQMCRALKLKYIPKLHGGDLPNRLRRNPWLCRQIFSHSYCNVAPSRYLLTAFRDAGFQTIFIPNTIELKNYDFFRRTQLRPKLLWVRSFSAIYNPEMALRVLSLIKLRFPDACMCMVGPEKNGNLARLKTQAEQDGLNVIFTGKLSKKEWTDLSRDYDIFINTTHFDNTPVSVIEAMALGLPVVSTNVGGIPFLLQHEETALLVDDNDAEAMAERVIELLSNPDLTGRIVENAIGLVRGFDSEKVKWEWLEILK